MTYLNKLYLLPTAAGEGWIGTVVRQNVEVFDVNDNKREIVMLY